MIRAKAPFLAALAVLALPASARRPMKVDDLITTVRVTDPRVSPDGKLVAYVRTTTELPGGKRNADIWVVPVDRSQPPRPLTRNEKGDNTPVFSPDGKRLAFLSTRGGSPQVYLLELSGGEPRKLTDAPLGAQAPLVFSPDGKRLAFVADTYPDCPDEACARKREEEKDANPVKVRKLTRLLHRHWDEWRTDVRHHVFVVDVESGATRDVTPGDFDSPTGQYEDGAVAFSPDGKKLAFVSNREGNDREAWTTNMDVFTVELPADAKAPLPPAVKVTQNPAADINPVFLPDGTLLVRAQRRAGFEADRWYLDAYPPGGGAKRTLFTDPDLSADEMAPSPDGKTVYFTAEKAGKSDLFAVPAAGGAVRPIASTGRIGNVTVTASGLVFTSSTLNDAPDVFRAGLDGSGVAPVTRENEALWSELDMAKPESRTVKGAGGAPVQYWLVKPPAFDATRKYPIVFLIHGGPQGAWTDSWSYRWNPTLWAAQGWVVVAPNPRGSSGFGQKFLDEVSKDWAGKVMTDLEAVFADAAALPYVDKDRQGIAGASYGGYAVDWLIGHTNRFKAAVTHDGVFNLESQAFVTEELWFTDWDFAGAPWTPEARAQFAKFSPHLHADKITTPTLVVTNELDFRVPVDQGLQLFNVLRRRGVPCEALVFPDEGHWVLKPLNSKRWHEEVFAWMAKYLK